MIQYAYAAVGSAAQPNPLMSMVPLLFIFVIFYFLLIRPQQKKAKEHKQLLETLKQGDMVITSSGIYATVVSVGDKTVEVNIADNVKIKIQKASVSDVINK